MEMNQELTGDVMELCLQRIHQQWPDVTTQSPYLIQRPNKFDSVVKYGNGKYAQIMHMSKERHWVAVTNVGTDIYGRARLFDSLGLEVSYDIKCAIASKFIKCIK